MMQNNKIGLITDQEIYLFIEKAIYRGLVSHDDPNIPFYRKGYLEGLNFSQWSMRNMWPPCCAQLLALSICKRVLYTICVDILNANGGL